MYFKADSLELHKQNVKEIDKKFACFNAIDNKFDVDYCVYLFKLFVNNAIITLNTSKLNK